MADFMTYLATLGPLEMTGIAGSICYIGAFGSVQLGLLDGNSMSYSLVNVLAAMLVALSLFAEFNLSAALIQTSWIVIGATGLVLRARRAWAATRKVFATTLKTEID